MEEKKSFPLSPCYSCGEHISDNKGFLAFDKFAYRLERLVEKLGGEEGLLKSEKAGFVNVITQQYLVQFEEHFYPYEQGEAINVGEYTRDLLIDMKAHKHRLKMVLKNPPEEFLVLLLHKECYGLNDRSAYYIELNQIDSERKALDWTFHLNEKIWLNRGAWIKTLEGMFGRNSV